MNPTAQLLAPEVLDLIERRRFAELRSALEQLAPADLADLITDLDLQEALVVFRLLYRDAAAETLAYLEPDRQQEVIDALGDAKAGRLLEEMDADDRAALFDELPIEVSTRLINQLSPENRRITQSILNYPEESVGRLTTPDYVRVRPGWTIAHALEHIRKYGQDAETVHWIFIVDEHGKLLDDLHIRQILLADPQQTVESLMDGRFIALSASDDREEAVRLMAKYDRTALPVLDTRGLLMGIVTVDDIADVAELEATEDVHKLGGLAALDEPYLNTGLVLMLRKRSVWLAVLLVMQVGTIGVMRFFEGQLEKALVLTLFVPMIISCGGNTGSQAASMVIRALALDEITPIDWLRIVRKELLTGLAMGGVLGGLGFLIALGLQQTGVAASTQPLEVGLTVGVAIACIILWGTLIGSMLPLVLERFGQDPAASSTPLVATLMDVSGLLIYFAVAIVILSGTLL
jgi:magnesium transporter